MQPQGATREVWAGCAVQKVLVRRIIAVPAGS